MVLDVGNMTGKPEKDFGEYRHNISFQPDIIKKLLGLKASNGIRSPHFWIILALIAVFTYIYYEILTAHHDIYVVLFFYPLMYAAITYRLRGVVFSGLVFIGILLHHSLLVSYDPYSLARSLLFAAFAFIICSLGATLLNYLELQLESYEEILALNEELNTYIERLKSTQKQLIQSEKMNALGQLSAAIAHELNNPLAGVLVYNKLLMKKVGGDTLEKEEAMKNLTMIESAVTHCSELVRGLLEFARQTEPVLQPIKISSVIDQVMSLVGHQAHMKNVTVIREDTPSLPPVMADFGQLQQVFINLVVNAVQATPSGGQLTIQSSLNEDGRVKISFQDTGSGIAPEHMDQLFTPFFTTKEDTKGVGLGLSISYGIIERHGGHIEVQSVLGQGSNFTVFLPAYQGEADLTNSPN